MSEEVELIKERLHKKKKQLQLQQERLAELQKTVSNTENEIEQLKYVLAELARIEEQHREPRVIPNYQILDLFKTLSMMFEYLQRRLHVHFKYDLVCHVIYARYQFQSRSKTPGREYLSFATVMAYFKRERGMVGA